MSLVRPSVDEIEQRILHALPGARLQLRDDSHLHAGHAGAQGGAGHFHVSIDAPQFAGLSKVRQHRLVYDAVQDWMPDRIHALSIEIGVL